MTQELSVAKVIANLEARLAFHREQEALHARQEEHHRDQRAVHAAEIEKVAQSLEAFRTTAATAVELARPVPPPPPPDDVETTMVSRLIARVVESRPADEPFGASSVAAEVNQRYGNKLERPVDTRAASVVLRRMRARRQIHLVRKGKAAQEALYRRGPKP